MMPDWLETVIFGFLIGMAVFAIILCIFPPDQSQGPA